MVPMIYKYAGTVAEEDILIAGWWSRMRELDHLARLFGDANFTPGALFNLMKPPTDLWYILEDGHISATCWVNPFMGGPSLGIWGPGRMHQLLPIFRAVSRLVFQHAPVIVSITCQPNLVALFARVGYTLIGEAPELYFGKTAYICTLRRDDFFRCNPEPIDGVESEVFIIGREDQRRVA